MMLPMNAVVLPSVADDPMFQNTPAPGAAFNVVTDEADAVVSVEPIWNTNTLFGLPRKFRIRFPVSCADDPNLYTPGVSVRPPRFCPVRSVVNGSEARLTYAANDAAAKETRAVERSGSR